MKALYLSLLLATAFPVSACTLPEHSSLGHKRLFLYGVPEGDDSFSRGWRDGCDTSLATVGTGTLRLIEEKIDVDTVHQMNTDDLYEKGFTTGSSYCTGFLDYNSG